MPEATIAAPPSPAAPQPIAQPASQSTAPAGTPTQVVDPAIAKEASNAFGAPAGTGRPEPASVEEFEEAEGQPAAEPVNTGDPTAATTTPGAQGGQPVQPVETPLPGEEFLKELDGVLPPDEAAPLQTEQAPDVTKPEELEKIINPDGKADLETRFKNAQSYIGKLHQQNGEKVKALNSKLGEFMQYAPTIQKMFRKDQSGNLGPNPEGILDVLVTVPPHEMEAIVASKLGMKLVPVNAKVDQADDPVVTAWEQEWANTAIPGNELTLAEKLTEIEGNPKMQRRFTIDQASWMASRRQQFESQRQEGVSRQRAEAEKDRQLVAGFVEGLKQKPDYETVLKPLLKRANAYLPPTVQGKDRLGLVNLIMHAYQVKPVMQQAVKDAYAKGRKDALELKAMGAIPAGGEQPDLETGELVHADPGQPGVNGEAAKAATAFGARAGRIS